MTDTKTRCYLSLDWGSALRISGELEAEFGEREVVGGWSEPGTRYHGTIFALESDRLPASWVGRLLRCDEAPTAGGGAARLTPHPDPSFEAMILGQINPLR